MDIMDRNNNDGFGNIPELILIPATPNPKDNEQNRKISGVKKQLDFTETNSNNGGSARKKIAAPPSPLICSTKKVRL